MEHFLFLSNPLPIASFAKPLCISEKDKALLTSAIWNDTLLLSSLFVMDYSLVVGIDETNGQYVVGIIGIFFFDYIENYLCFFLILNNNSTRLHEKIYLG